MSLLNLTQLFSALREKVERKSATEQEVLQFKAVEAEIITRTEPLFAKPCPVPPLYSGSNW
jgi:hypothetical protein